MTFRLNGVLGLISAKHIIPLRNMNKTKINKIGLAILILYAIFTIICAVRTAMKTDLVTFCNNVNVESVWLTGIPFHQVFEVKDLVEVRPWISNETDTNSGDVVVTIGDEDSGEILFEQRIQCKDITKNTLEQSSEDESDSVLVKGTRTCYIELYVDGVDGKDIKAYIGNSDDNNVRREGDERSYDGRGLSFTMVHKTIPSAFATWIIVTAMLISLKVLNYDFANKKMPVSYKNPRKRTMPENIILGAILIVMFFAGVWGKPHIGSQGRTINLEDEELGSGVTLKEHSSYHQTFTAESADISHINIHLRSYLINDALFVASIQKGTEEVIATMQSNEMRISGADASSYYIMDIDDVELSKGEEYDLYIYTGYIEDEQQRPTVTGIEYVYE